MLAEHFLRRGKVRDLFELPDGRLVLLASDRISAFDVVLPTTIADKGRVLTGLSRFWFAETAGIVPNHLLSTDPAAVDAAFAEALARSPDPNADLGSDQLRGRLMICRPTTVLPVEAVVRGYLAGSGWKEYRETGSICGVRLPGGLREGDRLPEPIFTPATKAPQGEHDQNIDFDGMIAHLETGEDAFSTRDAAAELADAIRGRAIRLYRYGHAVAERAGILLADTKFEFGLAWRFGDELEFGPDPSPELERIPGTPAPMELARSGSAVSNLILIDEVMTPDSSRFWDAAAWRPGGPQPSYDKQFVRDWLERQPWDKTAPGPALPDDVVAGTRARYVEAFERITGASFERYLQEDVIAR